MKKLVIAAILCVTFTATYAQKDEVAMKYAATITEEDLTADLTILASDALEGRETGERGQKMAAAYIREDFRRLGLEAPVPTADGKSFYQSLTLYSSKPGASTLTVDGESFNNFEDVVHFGSGATRERSDIEVVFAGTASDEMLEGKDLKGKAVFMVGEGMRSWQPVANKLQEAGASLILILNSSTDEEFATLSQRFKGYLSGGRLMLEMPEVKEESTEIFFVSPKVASRILKQKPEDIYTKASEMQKSKTLPVGYSISSQIIEVETENVLGYLEGTDKKDELIVLTAHYDHVGINNGEIHNGADDDGSGTTAIMEIAEAFVKAKEEGNGPRRSLLFMLVTGEEKGLLGSAYYAENPVYPLSNTVANLNIDMIGRVDPDHEDNPSYVYVVGSDKLSTELHKISEDANATYTKMDLDYTYNDQDHPDRIYYRSDHWNFAKNNIPVIFYFNGIHADYHKATDTVEKINFDMLALRAKLVFHTAWELANRDTRIVVDVKAEK